MGRCILVEGEGGREGEGGSELRGVTGRGRTREDEEDMRSERREEEEVKAREERERGGERQGREGARNA
eukprot:855635-Rhodomonas_salina.1